MIIITPKIFKKIDDDNSYIKNISRKYKILSLDDIVSKRKVL